MLINTKRSFCYGKRCTIVTHVPRRARIVARYNAADRSRPGRSGFVYRVSIRKPFSDDTLHAWPRRTIITTLIGESYSVLALLARDKRASRTITAKWVYQGFHRLVQWRWRKQGAWKIGLLKNLPASAGDYHARFIRAFCHARYLHAYIRIRTHRQAEMHALRSHLPFHASRSAAAYYHTPDTSRKDVHREHYPRALTHME
jgi:hypothetical protein